jgi:type II secretory pathway pseudopilin PulG
MKRLNNSGFTIIETTLVLAISGALIGALMIGTWSSINAQRYRDSVTSLESLIKQQYSDVDNAINGRLLNNNQCKSLVAGVGQSDCMILGKYLKIDQDGGISTSTVAGYRSDNTPAADGKEITALSSKYILFIVDGTTETSQLEWGAKIAWPESGLGYQITTTPRSIAFLFLHSPTSSLIYTFSSSDISTSLNGDTGMINDDTNGDPGQSIRNICVYSGDGFNKGLSVWVDATAFDASAVQIHSNDMNPADIYEAGSAFIGNPPKC